ncbi:hypothetical protein [Psychrobacillus sp. NPDC096389]
MEQINQEQLKKVSFNEDICRRSQNIEIGRWRLCVDMDQYSACKHYIE